MFVRVVGFLLETVFYLLMGAALLGERPGLWQLLGTASIIVGVLVIGLRSASPKP